jgi:hypothetical protein
LHSKAGTTWTNPSERAFADPTALAAHLELTTPQVPDDPLAEHEIQRLVLRPICTARDR